MWLMAQMKAYSMPMKKITLICNLVHLPKEFQNWVVVVASRLAPLLGYLQWADMGWVEKLPK